MECPDCSYSVSFGPAQGNDCGCSTPYLLQEDEVARAAEMIRTEPEVTGRVGLCLGQGAMLAGVVLFFSLFVFLAGGVVGIVDDVISDGETLSEAAAWYASESVGWWIGTGVVALVGFGWGVALASAAEDRRRARWRFIRKSLEFTQSRSG